MAQAHAFFSVLVLACAATLAPAGDAVFVKPVSTAEFGWNSNTTGTSVQIADDFMLAAPATIDTVLFYGFSQTGSPDREFRVRIFANDDGSDRPVVDPFYDEIVGTVTGTDTLVDNAFGRDIYEYAVDIPDIALDAGVPYWFSVGATTVTTWTWSHSLAAPAPDDVFGRVTDDQEWASIRGAGWPDTRMNQAFTLFAVPAPGAAGALWVTAMALGVRRRRV